MIQKIACAQQDGDNEALHVPYDCKLIYRLETEFSPYTRCDSSDVMLKLASFVVDPRFESDSLFLRLYGDALGPLADMVKAAYRYTIKAAEIKPRKVGETWQKGGGITRVEMASAELVCVVCWRWSRCSPGLLYVSRASSGWQYGVW